MLQCGCCRRCHCRCRKSCGIRSWQQDWTLRRTAKNWDAGKKSQTGTRWALQPGSDKLAARKLNPVVGRDQEIGRVIQILSRRTKNNPCLVGEPGVGKTAIVEGLALRITEGSVPDTVKDKRVLMLDLSGMIAGSKYRGEFEERIRKVIRN